MAEVSNRELNRWTLARQHLLDRVPLDVVSAVEALAGMQAQHSPSPYIGLWSRLAAFERSDLEKALLDGRIVKTTVMRGTLHLVPTHLLNHYRVATGSSYYDVAFRDLVAAGADLEAVRAVVRAAVGERALTRREVMSVIADALGHTRPDWLELRPSAVAAVSVTTDLVNLPSDAAFGHFGGSHYQVGPDLPPVDPAVARLEIARAYLAAYGPASKADLSHWSGKAVGAFGDALAALDLVSFRAEDGRTLFDLASAPRPPADTPAPVRFLPKWDSVLLAHVRRERIFPEATRSVVIRKNGDVLPTFLVDGMVAGWWDAPRRGKAVLTLTPLVKVPARGRREVEAEGLRLLRWLRPDREEHQVTWAEPT